MSLKQSIGKFKNGEIKNIETLLIELALLYSHNQQKIEEAIQDVSNEPYSVYSKVVEAHKLLNESSKIHENLKSLLNQTQFIDSNPKILLELAKLYFYADTIELIEDKIIASRRVTVTNEIESYENQTAPVIDVEKVIFMVLQKIKYDRLQNKDLEKLHELNEFSTYKTLYITLIEAINQQHRFKILPDDELKMTLAQLQVFLG